MIYTKEQLENLIRDTVRDVTGKVIDYPDTSLIDRALGIDPADFLYIFDRLEKELQAPVHTIFTNHGYEVMTVRGISVALLKLEHKRVG